MEKTGSELLLGETVSSICHAGVNWLPDLYCVLFSPSLPEVGVSHPGGVSSGLRSQASRAVGILGIAARLWVSFSWALKPRSPRSRPRGPRCSLLCTSQRSVSLTCEVSVMPLPRRVAVGNHCDKEWEVLT